VILVTGARGFLGRAVCAQTPSIATDLPCDISDAGAVAALFRAEPIDVVIHLAGLLPTACRADPGRAARVNVMGSVNLLEAAAAAGVRRFVFGSSISVYEEGDLYGAGKRFVETLGQTMGLPFVALRIATVVGAGARYTASPWRAEIFEKLGTGRVERIAIPFAPATVLSLVHVDDVARMLVLLATRPDLPAAVYDSPAERWTVGDLKQTIEALDARVRVDLDANCGKPPAAAEGAAFVRDFGWRTMPLADRLAACSAAADEHA